MKKIIIGITIALFSCFISVGFAATVVTSKKNEVTVPCYNGGYSFGLAGYSSINESDLNPSVDNSNPIDVNENQGNYQPDYK